MGQETTFPSSSTAQLTERLLAALRHESIPRLPEGVGLFYGFDTQQLRAVPIQAPTLIWVLAGSKRYCVDDGWYSARAGELIILPVETGVHVINEPDGQGDYLALCLSLTPADQSWLLAQQPEMQRNCWSLTPPEGFALSYSQWVSLASECTIPEGIQQHRRRELIGWLTAQGVAGNLLREAPAVKRQVLQLIQSDIAHPWRLGTIAERLHMSESTLHRQLGREGVSFRHLLEQARLLTGLGLLQGTRRTIMDIAASVGYQSPSRFAERFRQHFGLSPSELRETHEVDGFRRKNGSLRRAGGER